MHDTITYDVNDLGTSQIHKILLTAVAPRPIALVSTINKKGQINLSPFSFFNVFSANPPVLIFSPSRRVRNNTLKHTLENVGEVDEAVVNIVNFPMVEQMSLSSTEYEREVNEFKKSGLTPVAGKKVRPPLVKESPVSFECKVMNIIPLGKEGGAGNLVITKILYIHIKTKYLNVEGKLDTPSLDLVARMGENWYLQAKKEAVFEIPKPLILKGIGVDKLPKHIFKSKVFTGNDIGRLGNMEKVPSNEEVQKIKTTKEISTILKITDSQKRINSLHTLAKSYLNNGELKQALKVVFSDS